MGLSLVAPECLLDPVGTVLREDVLRYLLSLEIAQSLRYRSFFSVWLVGVDSPADDLQTRSPEFVRTLSRAIGEQLRVTDLIGLLPQGLAIVLLHAANQAALTVAKRLHSHLREVAMPGGNHTTISLGGACFPHDGQTEVALLTCAAQCLDVARQRGNLVVYHRGEA